MKLKKIVSLALAGILAVSMLAGCAEGSKPVEKPNDVTADTSIVGIINTAIAGNKAGISFKADDDFAAALKKVVAQKGVNDAGAIETSLATELDITKVGFDAGSLNTTATAATNETVKVYVTGGKQETALSAAYKASSQVNGVVSALKEAKSNGSGKLVKYTYSDANVSMVEVAVGDETYYVVAVGLTCEVKVG